MPYCPRCGVEVENKRTTCPLCTTPIPQLSGLIQEDDLLEAPEEREKKKRKLLSKTKRRITIEILATFFIPIVVLVFTIDLVVFRRITWSVYPALSLMTIFLVSVLPLILYRKPLILLFSYFLTFSGVVYISEKISGYSWFWTFGLPIVTMIMLCIALIVFLSIHSKRRGFNIPAYIFMGISLLVMGIEGILRLNGVSGGQLGWSLIVGMSVLPLIVFFLFVHYRLWKTLKMDQFFHT